MAEEEEFPDAVDDQIYPITKNYNLSVGGCFGYGPGMLINCHD